MLLRRIGSAGSAYSAQAASGENQTAIFDRMLISRDPVFVRSLMESGTLLSYLLGLTSAPSRSMMSAVAVRERVLTVSRPGLACASRLEQWESILLYPDKLRYVSA